MIGEEVEENKITLEELKEMLTLPTGTYHITISPHIHERLERHLLILKKLIDRGMTKQIWITSAIKEKLRKDSDKNQIPKASTLSVKIDQELDKLILERIEYVKKFRVSYSKKQWLVDAIIDKLDSEEQDAERKILETKQYTLSDKQQNEILKKENEELKERLQHYNRTLKGNNKS